MNPHPTGQVLSGVAAAMLLAAAPAGAARDASAEERVAILAGI